MNPLPLFRKVMGLPASASSVSDGVDGLDLALTLATAIVGFALIVYTIRLVRRGLRNRGRTPRLEASRAGEVGIAGTVTLGFVLFWVVGFGQFREMTEPPADAEPIYVEAKQWMWKFAYPDGTASNDVLTVPVGKPIKLLLGSRDVIHSFFVPAFRLKQDAVPGRTTTLWFKATTPGSFPIYCAEYCGVSHSAMLGTIVVLSPTDYEAWKHQNHGDGPARGREIATSRGCIACHSLDGSPRAGRSFLHLQASDETITRTLFDPPSGMPAYRGVLEPAEVGALLEFMRGLR